MAATLIFFVWLVKVTALLVLASGVTLGLRRAPAGARYMVWLATLVVLLLVPAISSWSPLRLPILPSAAPAMLTSALPGLATTPSPAADASVDTRRADGSRVPATTPDRGHISPTTLFLAIWGAVGALLLVWLLLGALAVRRIIRRGRVLTDETWLSPMYDVADRLDLDHAPRVIMSSMIEMPFACGILRPTVVLPSSAEQWSDERRRCVLFHELAHVRRHDLLGHTLGRIVCAFYWFHPLVWSAAKRLRAESERACDDLVLACGGARASDYANHLLEIVTSVRLQGAPATALPMADKREFEGRMLAILDPAVKRATPGRAQTMLLTVGLGALSLAVAAAAPSRRAVAEARAPESAVSQPALADTDVTREARPAVAQRTNESRPAISPNTRQKTNEENAALRSLSQAITQQVNRAVQSSQSAQGEQQVDTALLGKVLRTDKDARVRRSAAWVLNGHRDGIPLLLDRLRSDEDESVREMSAWALAGFSGTPDIASALIESLRRDKSDEVRATAAWGLGHMRLTAVVPALEAALADPVAEIRQRALWALGQQDLSTAPAKVVALLGDENGEVRLMAAWVLGEILDKSTIPAIREAFLKERDSETLQAEFRALLFMGDRSQAVIDRAMNHEDPEIRARAVRMIAGQGPGVWPWPWPWPEPRPEP